MALVRNGMVDLAAAVAHMAAEVVAAVPVVLACFLTFDPMTTVCVLFLDYIILCNHFEFQFPDHQC